MNRNATLEKQIELLERINDKLAKADNLLMVADIVKQNALAIKDLVEAMK